MRVLVVFFLLLISIACKKEKCYDCTQRIRFGCNKEVKGYPREVTTKLVSCGENIESVDNPDPIVDTFVVGDTIYTYWKDTDCKRQTLF